MTGGTPLIELRGVSKSWRAGGRTIEILRDVNLAVGCGERLALVGPSGAGKSTVLHVLAQLTGVDRGELRFAGRRVAGENRTERNALRRSIGLVFQDAKLIPGLNVMENVCVPLMHRGLWPARQRRLAGRMLAEVGLTERIDHRPDQLSSGEMLRVAIARALVIRPRVVLADEPTGALDSATGTRVVELLFSAVTRERALVMVTHNKELARQADRMVEIRDGRILH